MNIETHNIKYSFIIYLILIFPFKATFMVAFLILRYNLHHEANCWVRQYWT